MSLSDGEDDPLEEAIHKDIIFSGSHKAVLTIPCMIAKVLTSRFSTPGLWCSVPSPNVDSDHRP
jgi:hypothetical protein